MKGDYGFAGAVVLAGGQGSRLGFVEKALLSLNNRPLLSHIVQRLALVTGTIIVSLRDEAQRQRFSRLFPDLTFVIDRYQGAGPLAGMEAGLRACSAEYTLVLGCDMPFINTEVLKYLLDRCRGYDVTIPRWEDGRLEPLHAVYRTEVMRREILHSLRQGERIILAPLFRLKRIQYIDVVKLRALDPDLNTFKNVNTLSDMKGMV